jgi:ankyrin repeat protein
MKTNPSPEVLRAVELDDAGQLKEHIEAGLSPDAVIRFHSKTSLTVTLLEYDIEKGARAVTALLIKAGAKVNEGKFKPLIRATMGDQVEIVKLLLDAGADPNIKWNDPAETEKGLTPLMYAVGPSRDVKLLELLLARGADPNALTEKGSSALSRAHAYENNEAVDVLLQSGCKPLGTILLYAVYRGEADLVKKLVAAGADVNMMWNWKGERGHGNVLQGAVRLRADDITTLRSPLTAQRNRFERVRMEADARFKIVQELVGAGAKVDRPGSPAPPLYVAAAGGDLETIKVLLEAGADPNPTRETPGGSPLHAACRSGFVEIAECLLNAGADVKIRNADGRTALEELRQVPKSKEIENWEGAVREGARIEPGMMEVTCEAWNSNRARLIEILERIPTQAASKSINVH